MIELRTCPKCGHELIEDLIFTHPMARYWHCDKCGWISDEEMTDEDYQHD